MQLSQRLKQLRGKIPKETKFSIEEQQKKLTNLYQNNRFAKPFLNIQSNDVNQYFSKESPSEEQMKCFELEKCLQARFILIFNGFARYNSGAIKETVFFNKMDEILKTKSTLYKQYVRLKGQYQQRYVIDMAMVSQKNCKIKLKKYTCLSNYHFYWDQISTKLHSKRSNYQFLEDKHDYIQWMFPNHYQSSFNYRSIPLGYLQSHLFSKSQYLGLQMLISIEIFLDFLGIQLTSLGTLKKINDKRMDNALLKYTHNHLRLRRFIACLSITGFRVLALDFIDFLKQIIEAKGSKYNSLKKTFDKEWAIYGDNNKEESLKKWCFCQTQDFPPPNPICYTVFPTKFGNQKTEQKKKNILMIQCDYQVKEEQKINILSIQGEMKQNQQLECVKSEEIKQYKDMDIQEASQKNQIQKKENKEQGQQEAKMDDEKNEK